MGLKKPFAERVTAPAPGKSPEETVRALYRDEIFFNLRNSFPKPVTDHLAKCFTPSLLEHFETNRAKIDRWCEKYRNVKVPMKIPMGEGSIFLSCYEGGTSYRVGRAVIKGSTAKVPVFLTYSERRQKDYHWTDEPILRRVGDVWLLDDIRHDIDEPGDFTLRKRTSLPDP